MTTKIRKRASARAKPAPDYIPVFDALALLSDSLRPIVVQHFVQGASRAEAQVMALTGLASRMLGPDDDQKHLDELSTALNLVLHIASVPVEERKCWADDDPAPRGH